MIYGFVKERHRVPGGAPNLGLQAQSLEERRTALISFEFPRGLMNSAVTYSMTVGVLDAPFGTHLDVDVFIGPYSSSAPVVWELPNSATLFQWAIEAWGFSTLGTPLDLDPYVDLDFCSTLATSCGRFDQ
jgi:hypothetical protein